MLKEGEKVELNCSSEEAYPVVSLSWKRNGVETSLKPTEGISDGRVYSQLKITPTKEDNNAVYICEVTSISFPDRTQTCHVGPIHVIPNNNDDKTSIVIADTKSPKPSTKVTLNSDRTNQNSDIHIWDDIPEECRDTCASGTPMYYWILATVVAGSLALIFLLVCLTVLVKYYSMKTTTDHKHYLPGHLTAEEIYSEVEQKRGNRLYMALDKRDCNLNPTLECHNYIDTSIRRL